MLKSRRFWIGSIVSLVLLFLFFYRVDFGEIGRALVDANYIFVLPAIVVLMGVMGLKAVRWRYLLRPIKEVPLSGIFSVEVIGHMVNAVLPLRVGELARAYLLGEKESISKVSTLASVAVARAFDGLALLFFAVILSLFLPLMEWLKFAIYVVAILFVCALILFLLLASSQNRLHKTTAFLLRPLPQRWKPKLQGWTDLFIAGLEGLKSPKRVGVVFLLSLLVWVGEGVMFYLIAFSFDLDQPFHVLLLASTAANLALLLPSSPGGVGNFEYFTAGALAAFGVDTALARAYAIAVHAALLLPIILLGFYFLWRENISLAEMARGQRKRSPRGKGREGVKEDEQC